MTSWVLYTGLATLLYGFWAFTGKLATNYLNSNEVLIYQIIGGVLVGVLVLFQMNFRVQVSPQGLSFGLLFGIIGMVATLFFVKALAAEGANASIVSVVTALYPGITILLAVWFLNEVVTAKQMVGMGFAVISIYLLVS